MKTLPADFDEMIIFAVWRVVFFYENLEFLQIWNF